MAKTYARFADTPIGPMLSARNGGLTLTTTIDGASLDRTAISNVAQTAGAHGAEFTFWGDADILAAIGIVKSTASLATMVGGDAAGIGWRLDTGEVFINGVAVASGLPIVATGATVGVWVYIAGASSTIEFFNGATFVSSLAFDSGADAWHFAVSLGAPVAGTLVCAVNAGQWRGTSQAVIDGGWRPAEPSVAAVRLADLDWLSAPSDTPANARYEGMIDGAGVTTVAALGFWPWGADNPSQGASASLRVFDGGSLDALVQQDVSGVPAMIRQADEFGTLASALPVARFVLDRIEMQDDSSKVIYLRDAHDDLDESINPGIFLPSIPQLAWQPQPAVIGAVASVPALRANNDGSVAWLSDAPLASVSLVMDRGDPMEPGTWTLAADGQRLELAQPAVGPMVADVSSVGASMQPATLSQMLYEIFGRIEKSAWSSADAAAIDSATGYAGVGFYANASTTARQALSAILPSYGAWWWQDVDGVLRVTRISDPAAVADAALAFEFSDVDLSGDLVATVDEAPGLSRRMGYQPNAAVLSLSDLVTDLVDVPPARRDELTSLFRGTAYSGRALSPRYAHADTNAPIVSCFWRQVDAQAEIDRVCGLYALVRSFYLWRVKGDQLLAPKPGQVGRITYPRYGLAAGKKVMVRAVTRNPVTGEVTLTLWG